MAGKHTATEPAIFNTPSSRMIRSVPTLFLEMFTRPVRWDLMGIRIDKLRFVKVWITVAQHYFIFYFID